MLLLIDPLTPLYWTKREQMLGEYRNYYDQIQAGNSNYTLFGDEMATMPLPTSINVLLVVTPSHNATVLNRATVV